jgi:hypothetical protein
MTAPSTHNTIIALQDPVALTSDLIHSLLGAQPDLKAGEAFIDSSLAVRFLHSFYILAAIQTRYTQNIFSSSQNAAVLLDGGLEYLAKREQLRSYLYTGGDQLVEVWKELKKEEPVVADVAAKMIAELTSFRMRVRSVGGWIYDNDEEMVMKV